MKKLIGLLLTISLVLGTAACSANPTESSTAGSSGNSESTSTAEKTTSDFPKKPITIICPYGAGGGTDLALRVLAESGKDTFGQVINVENKTGGSGSVGLVEALNSGTDGYTLGTASVDLITLPLLGLAPKEVTREAFEPICIINGEPAAIIVKSDAKWNTIEDFIKDAKDNPGTIQLANSGMGNIWHLAAIGLELETGVSFNHIPYQDGSAQAIAGCLGGHVDAVICSAAEADANIKAGTMKVLAVANLERLKKYPDVPTFKEKNIDLTIVALRGLCVNRDVPDNVKQILKDGFKEVINSENCKAKIEEANMTYMPLDSNEADFILDGMSENFEKIINKYKESA